ncbi:conserved hypothetical protein [Uncinocarpus reesii 1704]|uniref:Uncharacterized protein n=1 Tax=Uncinocarpus reesii (strain UAMH 1704) TaxID=336963 RepID=C4JPB5_UNCRE|nr:uncharacterized protein UREG_04497 [Uncinocarpus reesii 1704]EEP79651.1 conserved hypothetical protein [Uncinocarpus reesii 1704]
MPPMKFRILISIIAASITAFFFWGIDRYDNAILIKVDPPVSQVASANSIHSHSDTTNKTPDEMCHTDKTLVPAVSLGEWLIRKNYTRSYMRAKFHPANTKFRSLEPIEGRVLPPFRALDRGLKISNKSEPWPCPPIVDVSVAADPPIDSTNQLLFGLATTVERLDAILPSLLYSYGNTKASLLVLVPDNRNDLDTREAYFRNRGLDLSLRPSPLEFTARYFGLVEAFMKFVDEERPHTKWVSFVDDDTFFPSLARIANKLATLDASKKHYIGALSEASWQVNNFGRMAFGGAGVFVSKGLLEALQPVYRQCQDVGDQPGDQKLGQCIKQYGKTKLTTWDSLYQMDMQGNPDGVFESGKEINSLHHWNTWFKKDVAKMSTVAVAAGRHSVLRRWRFDETVETDHTGVQKRSFWVLTNGYSLVRYTMDVNLPTRAINFDHTEKTWGEDGKGYENRLGPLRPEDQRGIQKDRWMLSDSMVVGNNVHQTYTRKGLEGHSVIELVWLGISIEKRWFNGDFKSTWRKGQAGAPRTGCHMHTSSTNSTQNKPSTSSSHIKPGPYNLERANPKGFTILYLHLPTEPSFLNLLPPSRMSSPAALDAWALPRLAKLLPLDDESLKQVIAYTASLPKQESATHLRNLLDDSAASLEFIAAFNSRRGGNDGSAEQTRTRGKGNNAGAAGRKSQEKKGSIHTPTAVRRPEGYGDVSGGYVKSQRGEEYIAGALAQVQISSSSAGLVTESVASREERRESRPRLRRARLISEYLPNVKSKKEKAAATSSPTRGIICALEGLQPCSFCGTPLLSTGEVQDIIRELRAERGGQKMRAHNESVHRDGGVPTPAFANVNDAKLEAAKAHRDKLLSFQAHNAQRTRVVDEAADFDMPTSASTQWMTPAQRALALKKQQRLMREMEERNRPEWERRSVVMSLDIKKGKVVRTFERGEVPRTASGGDDDGIEDTEAGVETRGGWGRGCWIADEKERTEADVETGAG